MATFSDILLSSLQRSSREHSGLHFVPSFNDLNSGAADDVDAEIMHRDQTATDAAMPAAKRMSNKSDSLPAVDPLVTEIDVHKVGCRWSGFATQENVSLGTRREVARLRFFSNRRQGALHARGGRIGTHAAHQHTHA